MKKKSLFEQLQKEGRVIPAISDTLFKKVMTEHKDYLGIILENVMPLTKEMVMEGEFENIEIPSSNELRKSNRLDLIFKTGDYKINLEANKRITVELLLRNEAHFAGLIYKEYSDKEKINYNSRICQVNFNGENRLANELVINLMYRDPKLKVEEKRLSKVELNLGIALKKYYNKSKLSRFEKALALLLLEEKEKIEQLVKGDNILEKVAKDIMSYSEAKEIVDLYEADIIDQNIKEYSMEYEKNLAREEGLKEGLEQGIEKGIEQGIEQGIEKGIEKGIEQGLEQGTRQSKIEIATELLKNNVSKDVIMKSTGLTESEIEELEI